MARPTRVTLALGAGGARGYAHIGVIEELEERGYEIVGIAGASMGALVGGLYAAGQLSAYTDWVCSLTQRDVLGLLDPSIKAWGAIRAEKILAKVGELLGDARIEDLDLPFTAVATDLFAGREVWFQRGPVDVAIRASIALPTFITPVVLNGRLLADGGLLNPIPVAATVAVPADITVGVSLSEEHLTSRETSPDRESAEQAPIREWLERSEGTEGRLLDNQLVRTVASWFTGGETPSPVDAGEDAVEELNERRTDEGFGVLPSGMHMLNVMQLSLAAMQSLITRHRLAGYPPDLLITVPETACRTLDFHRADEMITLGRQRTSEALDRDGRFPVG